MEENIETGHVCVTSLAEAPAGKWACLAPGCGREFWADEVMVGGVVFLAWRSPAHTADGSTLRSR